MTVFAHAIADLFADPHLAVAAIYRAGGEGDGIAVRVMVRAPDQITEFGAGRFVTTGRLLDVRTADVATLAPGDTFEMAGATYIVQGEPRRDGEGLVWSAQVVPA